MRLPRVTIGRLMALVVVAAIVSWAGFRAHEVYLDYGYHIHIDVDWIQGHPVMAFNSAVKPPFWPRYWRHLLGRPWKGQPLCSTENGHVEEVCSLVRPEIVPTGPPGSALVHTREIDEAYARMTKHWEDRNSPGWSPAGMPK